MLHADGHEAAIQCPAQLPVLSRMTEVLFVGVLRSWIKSLGPAENGWLGVIADRHIGKVPQLIDPEHPWTRGAPGRDVGLARSAFAAGFCQARRPVYAPLPRRASDGRGGTTLSPGSRSALAMRRRQLFPRRSSNATAYLQAVT
jgi:hypothetical protein